MSTAKRRLLAYVIMLASGLVSIKLAKDVWRLWHADDRLIEAEAELKTTKEEQERLQRELESVGEADWRERQIRDTLKMARPNEEVVIIPEEILSNKDRNGGEAEEGEELSNWRKWWQVFGGDIIND